MGISGRRTKSRERVLADAELKRIWTACEDFSNHLPASFRRIVKLLILTGQRRSEVAALQGEFSRVNSLLTTAARFRASCARTDTSTSFHWVP